MRKYYGNGDTIHIGQVIQLPRMQDFFLMILVMKLGATATFKVPKVVYFSILPHLVKLDSNVSRRQSLKSS